MKWIIILIVGVGFPYAMYQIYNRAFGHTKSKTEEIRKPEEKTETAKTRTEPVDEKETVTFEVVEANPDSPSPYPSSADGTGREYQPGDISPQGIVKQIRGSGIKVLTPDGETKYLKTTHGSPRVESYRQLGFTKSGEYTTLYTAEFGKVSEGSQLPQGLVVLLGNGVFTVRRADGSLTRYIREAADFGRAGRRKTTESKGTEKPTAGDGAHASTGTGDAGPSTGDRLLPPPTSR